MIVGAGYRWSCYPGSGSVTYISTTATNQLLLVYKSRRRVQRRLCTLWCHLFTPRAHFVKILAKLPTSSRISQHIRCIRSPGSDLVCHASPHRHNERRYDAWFKKTWPGNLEKCQVTADDIVISPKLAQWGFKQKKKTFKSQHILVLLVTSSWITSPPPSLPILTLHLWSIVRPFYLPFLCPHDTFCQQAHPALTAAPLTLIQNLLFNPLFTSLPAFLENNLRGFWLQLLLLYFHRTPDSSQPSSYQQLKLASVTPVINFFIL
jgi:hypothetical protein